MNSDRPARAYAENDWIRDAVRIAIQPGRDQVVTWPSALTVRTLEPGTQAPEEAWLSLPTDLARALYEALADHFGHSGHDTRALRRDYDAERARVDRFIAHLTAGTP